ncbi:hypothetical protein KKC13_11625 [bacterium]|nr:hypothetical protein [bacterium]MBU1957548.1 hypothetical protein [bacterium]
MKKYLPIILALFVVAGVAFVVIDKKNSKKVMPVETNVILGNFNTLQNCSQHPRFLNKLKVQHPVTIDLSQQHFTGLAFLWGQNFSKVIHPKQWETFEHFSTYALDEEGNVYLAPMPFISIKPTTFNLQKNIYKLDSITGKISIFMKFDDVLPTANNPYGIISLVYDCDDKTLWVSAIDETDYRAEKGVIYHIDPQTKTVLQRIEGRDALTLTLLKSQKGKYLLAGSARENALYAFSIENAQISSEAQKVLALPRANEHIRKIKIRGQNHLELQTIPFTYSLVAQTVEQGVRSNYDAKFNTSSSTWELTLQR